MTNKLTEEIVRKVPKVLLHEHLDGGLRPKTILELAEKDKIDLPEGTPEAIAEWFHRGASRGSLPLYLEGFGTTIAVMQTKEALERVAYESLIDAHLENICYAEMRFHPGFHTQKGLSLEDVMNSVLSGMSRAESETGIKWGLIVCAMRNMEPSVSMEMAELAVNYRSKGVVGFDLAGEEAGHPPKKHVDAFHYIQRENGNITIHAGEAFGIKSIWQAIQWCGAHRIGHATHLIEDITLDESGKIIQMGPLAQYILDKRVPLEICLLSNVQTGAVSSIEAHPLPIYWKYKFRITVNTDNRLMSNTTMTNELMTIIKHWNFNLDDLEKLALNAMKSSFLPYKKRLDLIYNVIKTEYAKIRIEMEK